MEVTLLVLRIALIIALYAFLGVLVILLWRDVRLAARRDSTPALRERPARLVVLGDADGLATGTAYALRPHTSLGRSPTNVIELNDTYCSAEHALILWRNGQWWIEDRDSRNGTLLNGQAVETPVVLSAGDIIGLGRTRMRFETESVT